jgi:hypothetical protein
VQFSARWCIGVGARAGNGEIAPMKDAELRGIVLRTLYERRNEELAFGFDGGDPIPSQIDKRDWLRVCEQLGEQNLIDWEAIVSAHDGLIAGTARIKSFGVDVVEGTTPAPVAIQVDQSQRIDIRGSQGVQIAGAHSNQHQTLSDAFERIISAIDSAKVGESEKREVKSLILKVLDSKVVAAILGPAAGYLAAKYFQQSD